MALKLNEKYPGYMNAPSVDYPQGSFKNRSAPTVEDGSYFEKDWANDLYGLFQSILAAAGVTANGQVDKVGASQYFNALNQIIQDTARTQATETTRGAAAIANTVKIATGINNTDFITPKGLKDAGMWPLGVGQTWTDMTASRSLGVVYTNTSGRPIYISVIITGDSAGAEIYVDNVRIFLSDTSQPSAGMTACAIIPAGSKYSCNSIDGSYSKWMELR